MEVFRGGNNGHRNMPVSTPIISHLVTISILVFSMLNLDSLLVDFVHLFPVSIEIGWSRR